MTSMTADSEILKTDRRGRVRVSADRREALLEEFGKSNLSAAKFAQLAGLNYATFNGWVTKRRQRQRLAAQTATGRVEDLRPAPVSDGCVRLLEAVVESAEERPAAKSPGLCGAGLVVELPGGSRLRIESPGQLPLVAELVTLIAQSARARC
jgi:hypothetical protein